MNIEYCFIKVLQQVNQLSSNGGQLVTKWKFVEAFNKAQLHWVKYKLSSQANGTTDINSIYNLLKFPTLERKFTKDEFSIFDIPSDFLWFSSAEGMLNNCRLDLHFTEEYNIESLIKTGFFSTKFEEGLIHLRGDEFVVYPHVNNVRFTYFRQPVQVNMLDIEDPIEGLSQNVDPEWNGVELEEILDLTSQILAGRSLGDSYSFTSRHIQEHNKSA